MSESLVERAKELLCTNDPILRSDWIEEMGFDEMLVSLCQAAVDADEMLQMKAHINYSNLTGLEIAWVRKYSEVKRD